MDRYSSISELLKHERENVDFRVLVEARAGSPIAIVAPHGGQIEPGTGELARALAGEDLSCYVFEGIKKEGNYESLHVTSHHFDEIRCLDLISRCRYVVTIHGCVGNRESIYLGGLDQPVIEVLAQTLGGDFQTSTSGHPYPARDPMNICNRGASGKGVQIELTRGLRRGKDLAKFVSSVRNKLLDLNQPN